jgi:hypothetical protein
VREEMGDDGRVRRLPGRPAVTPDMLWPAPEKTGARRDERSLRASRMNHPSVRASRRERTLVLAPTPEPTLILDDGYDLVDLSECGNGCGNGVWCIACRADIRAEALNWLRELNVPRPAGSGTVLSWNRAWHREILVADN